MKKKTLFIINSISRSPLRFGLFLAPLAFVWLALSPAALAVVPPPDGGYPGNNTAEGTDALFSLTTGPDNTALGFHALYGDTTGDSNTAIGSSALESNTTGIRNTAIGYATLSSNTTGERNTATGRAALANNTTGSYNVASGHSTLFFNTTGIRNTATGSFALVSNSVGNRNTADGYAALNFTTTGNENTAQGYFSLYNNTTGNNNTAAGFNALLNNTTGTGNIALGNGAGGNLTTGNDNIDIGNAGVAGETGAIRIGTVGTNNAAFIAGINGVNIGKGLVVEVDASGHLGTRGSSQRFKDEIKPMDKASEAILALKPVTFRYKRDIDPEGTPQFGLVAEQVEKVNPDLVIRDDKGKIYTVRYDAVNAMLLNEFIKEHRTVEELRLSVENAKTTIAEQQKAVQALTASLKEQAAQIQKVSAKIELNQPALKTVSNP